MTAFLYPFMTFFQPGIFWPDLAEFRPAMVLSVLCLVAGLASHTAKQHREAFSHPICVLLLSFIGIQIFSLFMHGISTGVTGLLYLSAYLAFVLTSVSMISSERGLIGYVSGMVAGGMFLVLFGIYAVATSMPNAVGGRAGTYGMYENHNDYSFVIIQILPFVYACRRMSTNVVVRLLLGVSFVACIVGILLSLSRGGMLALVLEMALIVLIGMEGRKRFLWLPVLVIVGAAALGYQWAKRAENQGDSYTSADAENSRLELWRAGGAMLADHPLLGVGSGLFNEYAQFYGEISHDNRGKNSHNTYLEVLTGTGLIGFTIFIAFIVHLLRSMHRIHSPRGPPVVDALRRATLIGMYSILLRATLDAKTQDWSFYMFAAIGIGCVMLYRRTLAATGVHEADLDDIADDNELDADPDEDEGADSHDNYADSDSSDTVEAVNK